MTERGNARTIVQGVSPLSLELASAVLDEAEKEFGKIDRSIVFPMADHLDFAVRRIQNGEQISNPLTDDIRVMFYKEYKVASCIRELLKERLQIEIDEHEIGYLALHVHSQLWRKMFHRPWKWQEQSGRAFLWWSISPGIPSM